IVTLPDIGRNPEAYEITHMTTMAGPRIISSASTPAAGSTARGNCTDLTRFMFLFSECAPAMTERSKNRNMNTPTTMNAIVFSMPARPTFSRNPKISTYTEALMVGETSAQIWPRYVFWFSASALDEASTWMKERRCHSSLKYGINRGRTPICSRSFSWTAVCTDAWSKTRSSGGGTRGASICSVSPALTTSAPIQPGHCDDAELGASAPYGRCHGPVTV